MRNSDYPFDVLLRVICETCRLYLSSSRAPSRRPAHNILLLILLPPLLRRRRKSLFLLLLLQEEMAWEVAAWEEAVAWQLRCLQTCADECRRVLTYADVC
jgi:hypothetical protein